MIGVVIILSLILIIFLLKIKSEDISEASADYSKHHNQTKEIVIRCIVLRLHSRSHYILFVETSKLWAVINYCFVYALAGLESQA